MGSFRDGRHTKRRGTRRARLLPAVCDATLAKQRDVIASWQLRDAGLSSAQVEALVDAGLLRVLPGRVYTTRRSPLERDAQRWSAIVACGPNARLTGSSALEVARVRESPTEAFHVVVPGSATRRTPGVVIHRTQVLDAESCTLLEGYPATTLPRALVDAAAESSTSTDDLADYLDRAVALKKYDEVALRAALDARPHLRGRGKLIDAMATLDASSGRFLSAFERRTVQLVKQSRLISPPVVNVLIEGYRPDLRWINTWAIVECDGRDYHRSMAQVLADEERERRLLAAGFVILRLRWEQVVYHPDETLRRIEAFVLAHPMK